ncbi:MAG: S41 family peptidase [Clostridia bacterium]|nr:S41 family peptidase [Clostridia bacterium]
MKLKRIISVILTSVMLAPTSVTFAKTDEKEYSGEYQAFKQIAEYVSERYIDASLTTEDIMAQGLSAMLEGNDPLLIELLKSTLESMDDYSEFYTAEEYKAFQQSIEKTFYGIGITMQMLSDGYVQIVGFVEENGTAEKNGFKIGDKIYKVDGVDVTGWTMEQVRSKVIGEENTTVRITVLRDGEEIELKTTRVAVHEDTVGGGVLVGNIGYIQITSFSTSTYPQFVETLNFLREKGVEKIILDLRNNGGGIVTSAVDIAKDIVPKGKIIDVKYRQSEYDITYKSTLAKKEFDWVVLVNENTASAAEILASAMQDSGAAKLVGTTTYGKAVIQNMFPLTNGSVFKLTVGEYITRNGREINHIGLTPNEYVENVVSKIDTKGYSFFDFETKSAFGAYDDNVRAAKERLKILGFFEGETDNKVFDSDLKEAISDFQKASDLFSYGILDIATQVSIEKAFSAIETTTDEQRKKAYTMLGGNADDLFIND